MKKFLTIKINNKVSLKDRLVLLLVLFPIISFSQTGINTTNPKATLHVEQSEQQKTIPVGVILPRVTGEYLETFKDLYSQDQNGAVVFVTELPKKATSVTAKIVNVQEYYYYDASRKSWHPFDKPIPKHEDKIVVILHSKAMQYLGAKKSIAVAWDANMEGINSSKLKLVDNGTSIILPPKKRFRITSMFTISGEDNGGGNVSTDKPAYVLTNFQLHDGADIIIKTTGFVESSTEKYDDGGVTNALLLLSTKEKEVKIQLNANNPSKSGTRVSGRTAGSTPGTYLIIEEL